MEYRTRPLSTLKEAEILFTEVRKIAAINNDIIMMLKDEPPLLHIQENISAFHFKILDFEINRERRTIFFIEYQPENVNTIDTSGRMSLERDMVIQQFNHWIENIRTYSKVSLTTEERFTRQYEDFFYLNFELIDDDAAINPFELEKQIAIHEFLESVQFLLENNSKDYDVNELIAETIKIKKCVSKYTQKAIVIALSGLLARIQKNDIGLLKIILPEIKKLLLNTGQNEIDLSGFLRHFVDVIKLLQ
jgi:hypothetical protein